MAFSVSGDIMIGTVILLFLTFAGTLYLETQLRTNVVPELFLLCVGVIVAFLLVAGESLKTRWTWKLSTAFYAIAMANLAFLFMSTQNLLLFAGTLLVAVIAFIRSVSRLEMDWEHDLEAVHNVHTYEVGNDVVTPDSVDPIIVQTTTPAKRKKAKKKRKKKSRR